MKSPKPYDDDRLARLLGLLRPAPVAWVRTAQRIPLASDALSEDDVAALQRKLEADPVFRDRFDVDPVAAAEAVGMEELAGQLRRELRELLALAERIARDDSYRAEVAEDPLSALGAVGVPEETIEPLLRELAAPEEWLAKLPEVVAHRRRRAPLKARLLNLLLGSAAVGIELRSVRFA